MKKYLFFLLLHFTFFIFHSSIASAIEVGGHLTENTFWSPDDNPYEVTETIYVDSDVTLTILPGTEIRISGAPCTNWDEQSQNFWLHDGVSTAKMFWVDGKIIAEGTQQDSILFTRLQNDNDYYWGCIYLSPQSELSSFRHCVFEYSAGIGIAVGNIAQSVISIYNGEGFIKKCLFHNNASPISTLYNLVKNIEIIDNIFVYDNNINSFSYNLWARRLNIYKSLTGFKPTLVAGNIFNDLSLSFSDVLYVNNINNTTSISIGYNNTNYYFWGNNFNNCERAINGGIIEYNDSFYISNNHFIGHHDAIDLDYTFVEISDNTFEDCDVLTGFYTSGSINNNRLQNGSIYGPGQIDYFNNISYENENGTGICATYQRISCTNNLSINNLYAFEASFSFDNCMFLFNEELEQFGVTGTPIFRNCILDFELEYPLIDGGGNIWVDSLQAQEIFEDIENGDFHLSEGSIAIDAGFDTTDYYYPFDMDYSHRVWDGDEDGNAIIDIGPYEYGSPSWGGIEGFTYNPETGEAVDYVLLKINNGPGEFTFSNSIGYFNCKLPAGVYDIYAERVFYDDVIEYEIEVIDGEFTAISIPMFTITETDENGIITPSSSFNLRNYPNPFKPSGAGRGPATTISFSLTANDAKSVKLGIYNIKGQKIKNLSPSLCHPELVEGLGNYNVIWDGKDENNQPVGSGIYYCKLKSDKHESVKKILVIK